MERWMQVCDDKRAKAEKFKKEPELKEILRVISENLRAHNLTIVQVYLFGSRAKERGRPDSDWDVYVLVNRPLSFQLMQSILSKIYSELAKIQISADIILKYHKEFDKFKDVLGHLGYEVNKEGIPLL
jgi:predicted nucleotidyltransferase